MTATDRRAALSGVRTGAAPSSSRDVVFAWLKARLLQPNADVWICVLACLLLLPALGTGLAADDYIHTIMLDRPAPISGYERGSFDLFRFCDPQHFRALLDEGLFTWWDNPQGQLAFMRPLSSVTHALDHRLFRDYGPLMHLHSLLWAALLFLGVRALFSALIPDKLVANLALALYALDDARGWLVSWVAARNAAIATALSVWTLLAHHSGRNSAWRRAWGPSLFACALLAGEGSLATLGYLVGYALFMETGGWLRRLRTLWPYALVVVAWCVAYRTLGYGAHGSGLYADLQSDPLSALRMLFTNAPLLLGSQFGGMWSDFSLLLFALPKTRVVVYCATCSFLLWILWLARPALRTSDCARFGALGALLAVVPASLASPTMDRLLTWVSLGASVLLAHVIAPHLREGRASRESRVSPMVRATITLLVATQVLGVLLLPVRARANLLSREMLDRTQAAIPSDASIAGKTLIFINPPFVPYATYVPIERAARHMPRARAQHVVATSATPLHVQRVDPFTLRLRPRDGFLIDPLSQLLWSSERSFSVGERLQQGGLTVTVRLITTDHRPLEVDARFERPLEDPSYVWVQWVGSRSEPFRPPPVGEHAVLAGADYVQTLVGFPLPVRGLL
jgi:hypothetical protein